MRALLQRVSRASVTVDGEVVGEVGAGLCAFVGVTHDDDETAADKLANKMWNLRIFEDDEGKLNRSVAEAGAGVLVVSQFTLYADTRKGRRPSFVDAARPEHAEPLVERLCQQLEQLGASVATGRFRAEMMVEIHNDGPITVSLEV